MVSSSWEGYKDLMMKILGVGICKAQRTVPGAWVGLGDGPCREAKPHVPTPAVWVLKSKFEASEISLKAMPGLQSKTFSCLL